MCLFERGQAANELYVLVDGQIDFLRGTRFAFEHPACLSSGGVGALTAGLRQARYESACDHPM